MWEPRLLTILWASMACYRDRFTLKVCFVLFCIKLLTIKSSRAFINLRFQLVHFICSSQAHTFLYSYCAVYGPGVITFCIARKQTSPNHCVLWSQGWRPSTVFSRLWYVCFHLIPNLLNIFHIYVPRRKFSLIQYLVELYGGHWISRC
jgi:hypothetical protein